MTLRANLNRFELKVSFLGLVTFGKKLLNRQWIKIKIADVPYVKNYKIVIIWKTNVLIKPFFFIKAIVLRNIFLGNSKSSIVCIQKELMS